MAAGFALRGAKSLLSYTPDDSMTNDTFSAKVCAEYTAEVNALTISALTTVKWFQVPSCVSNWTTLNMLTLYGCQMPNFTQLPPSITVLSLHNMRGTWSHADAGTGGSAVYSDYFSWDWLDRLPDLNNLFFSGLSVNGTFPNHLSHAKLESWTMSISSFSGTLTPNWFLQYPAITNFYVYGSQLTGTIPYYGLKVVDQLFLSSNQFTHWPSLIVNSTSGFESPSALMTIDLTSNNLVQLPSDSSFQLMTKLVSVVFENNAQLSVPFPQILNRTSLLTVIKAGSCNFTGSLPAIPANMIDAYKSVPLNFQFHSNRLTGTIPSSWSSLSFSELYLQGNTGLRGPLATIDSNGQIVSQFITDANFLGLSGAGYTGPMFNITNMPSLSSLSIQAPNVDFCIQARMASSDATVLFPSPTLSAGSCSFATDNASLCTWAYPLECMTDSWAPVDIPPFESGVVPTPAPTTSVPVPAISCPLPSPGTSFYCVGRTWVSTESVTQGSISVPAASTTVINGNLTASTIVLTSATSTINVTGCVTSLDGSPSITVTLTQADLEEIVKNGGTLTTQLILQSASCDPISSVVVDTKSIKSCKTIKTDQVESSGIVATFTVNSSKCNRWWIIVVSVVCGVVLIAIVIMVILVSCSKAVRHKVLPFSKPRTAASV